MNIIDNRKNKCEFVDLNLGDCFMHGGILYLAIDDIVLEEDCCDAYEESDVKNAVNLKNGLLEHFNGQDKVERVNAQITISNFIREV